MVVKEMGEECLIGLVGIDSLGDLVREQQGANVAG
jgi:hypothetical protein